VALGLLSLSPPPEAAGQAILNVERLQGDQVEGLHLELAGRLRLDAGNTDLLEFGGDLGVGRLFDGHWIRAYLGTERIERKGRGILDNRYLHFRYNAILSDQLRTFHFYQLQSNENLFIDRRHLIGTGIRARIVGNADTRLEVGTGLMWEKEKLNPGKLEPGEDVDTVTWRVANLIVGSGPIGKGNRWVTVVYYQPTAGDIGDYRLSGDLGIAAGLTEALHLDVTLTWRHDSRAPANLKQDDLGFRTGFTFRIR
jgi:hypothetical protein